MVAVETVSSIFHLIFITLKPTKMSISGDESDAELPEPFFPTLPDKEQYTERILIKKGLREFLVVNHTANIRKNSKISAIWYYRGERHRLDDKSLYRY
jgi:hypothetical protein